jgi:UDP:flavonoid glycosyltransferase YjiC (YdhE family)
MRCKKYLLVPGNNSLSHVVKCLAIGEALALRGHKARVAVSRKHSIFLTGLAIEHLILPDIQETDESGFPSVEWFRQPRQIIDCINAEVALLKSYRPDRVLGVFRFTLKTSARISGVPYDSLVCGCMIPDSGEVLGFAAGEEGREIQQIILEGFYRYAGSKIGAALVAFGLPKSNGDIRHMLKGERTLLWDFPEFAPLPKNPGLHHVGPLAWHNWPYDIVDPAMLDDRERPLAVVAFGTCTVSLPAARRIIRVLIDLGYRVLMAAGGQSEFMNILPGEPHLTVYSYAPLNVILPHASLLVTHGGQMTVFEALLHEIPVIVMPFQPEQNHNGVCLERMGCGKRLVPSRPFQGNPGIYSEALEQMTDEEIACRINRLVQDPLVKSRLVEARQIVGRYNGAENAADLLEEC